MLSEQQREILNKISLFDQCQGMSLIIEPSNIEDARRFFSLCTDVINVFEYIPMGSRDGEIETEPVGREKYFVWNLTNKKENEWTITRVIKKPEEKKKHGRGGLLVTTKEYYIGNSIYDELEEGQSKLVLYSEYTRNISSQYIMLRLLKINRQNGTFRKYKTKTVQDGIIVTRIK